MKFKNDHQAKDTARRPAVTMTNVQAEKENMKQNQLHLWLRIGDGGDYEDYGQDEMALADALYESRIFSGDIDWLICPRNPIQVTKRNNAHYLPRAGFRTNFHDGDNYVSLYWGNEEGDLVQPLTRAEQKDLIKRLEKLEEDDTEEES